MMDLYAAHAIHFFEQFETATLSQPQWSSQLVIDLQGIRGSITLQSTATQENRGEGFANAQNTVQTSAPSSPT